MNDKKIRFLIIFSFLFLIIPQLSIEKTVHAFSPQVIQHGAVGDDVIELQARLQYIGFYNGKIDGVLGWGTYWALRNFQYEFGLEVDGMAGQTTKNKLASVSNYDEQYIKQQINQGKEFTHYGGGNKQTENQQQSNNQGQTSNNQGGSSGNTAVNVQQGYSQNEDRKSVV